MGSSIDDFLKEEGIFEETQAQAIKEVVAWQLAEGAVYDAAPPRRDEFSGDDEPLAWEAEGWENLD